MGAEPVVSPVGGSGAMINSRYTRLYNNPHFDYLTEMLPKDIKQLFQWCEIVYNSMPVIANGVRKLINYPVTDFSFISDSEEIRKRTRDLARIIKLKSIMLDFGSDYYIYGNVFRTIYLPFHRFLVCTSCKTKMAIDHCEFKTHKRRIVFRCPTCMGLRACEIEDVPTYDSENIRIVRWDPKQIELSHNPITGSMNYYYELPKTFVKAVTRGDITVFRDTPKIFIDAALAGRNVQLGSNFYHAKTPGMAGYASGWGIPPLMSTLKGYMYIAVLRRAAEAIGMEHITPQRIVFPQGTGSTDPCVMSSMERWRKEITQSFERWRMDPNYIMMAPYPTGMVNIGSQGRQLIPTEEIKDARMEMALALDIPPGLIMGDTSIQNSAVSLRILENQLTPYVSQLTEFANWLIHQINAHMNREYCDVELVPFKLADDLMNKQMLMQAVGTTISRTTLQEIFNLDPDRERERMAQDQVNDSRMQSEVEHKIQREQENAAALAIDAEQSMASGQPSPYNQQKMIAMAQEQAMQLMQVPYEERKSMLMQLQKEDYVMWALVSKQLEQMHREQDVGHAG